MAQPSLRTVVPRTRSVPSDNGVTQCRLIGLGSVADELTAGWVSKWDECSVFLRQLLKCFTNRVIWTHRRMHLLSKLPL